MRPLDTAEGAKLLQELGQRSLLRGGNPYRAKAYAKAAENLLAVPDRLDTIVAQNRLREIPGIGPSIADIIVKLHRHGAHPLLDELRGETPKGVLEMLGIPGLRPEKILKIHQALGIASLAELEKAAKENRLASVKGLGAGLQAQLLQGIEIKRQGVGSRHVHRADELLGSVKARLLRSKEFERITPAGDFRRGCELVSKLSLVAEAAEPGANRERPDAQGQVSIHVTDSKRYGAMLLLATGSDKHLEELRALATERGMTLDEEGLSRGGKLVAGKTEEEIYQALGLRFIAPELREGQGEVALALKGELPDLVTDADIRGILHAHTDRSDGVDTLEAMAKATRDRGYQYFGVADHSKSAHYAGGLSVEEIEEQQAEVERLNRRFGARFRIFNGIESDILADGSLDYPDEVLATFDFVVASIHSRFKLGRKEQTERMVRAVQNPRTTILGHMTGRQLLRRPGYEVDVEKVLKQCAAHRVAVEINANPWRLDLDWRWHRRALELGCMMSINPDAHDTGEIDLTHWGVAVARKGGVPKDRVLNCMGRAEIETYFEGRARPPSRKRRT